MSIIKSQGDLAIPHTVEFNFEDVAAKADAYLDVVKKQGREILEKAQSQKAEIQKQLEKEARAEAEKGIQQRVQELARSYIDQHLDSLSGALSEVVQSMQAARQSWTAHWEHQVIHLATAIAGRILRTAVDAQPEIPLKLLQEAIVLASGSPTLVVRLHPHDFDVLGDKSQKLVEQLAPAAETEIVSDPHVTRGGCIVESEFGEIDQRFESQLERIVEELT